MAETEEIEQAFDVPAAIKELIASGDPETVAKDARLSGWSVPKLKTMSCYLGLGKNFGKKKDIIAAIFGKVSARQSLDNMMASANDNSTFNKDKHTFPRLCNLIMQFPDAVQRCGALASKEQLQNKEVNENQQLFTVVATQFNDWKLNSGGVIDTDDELLDSIDTEKRNKSGPITAALVFAYWKDVVKMYSIYLRNWEASGKHNGHDFWQYCQGNLNVYYLHLWLCQLGNPEVSAYCAEGTILPFGVDSGAPPTESSTSSSSTVHHNAREKYQRPMFTPPWLTVLKSKHC